MRSTENKTKRQVAFRIDFRILAVPECARLATTSSVISFSSYLAIDFSNDDTNCVSNAEYSYPRRYRIQIIAVRSWTNILKYRVIIQLSIDLTFVEK